MKYEEIRHKGIVHPVPGMDDVCIQKNIPYKQEEGVQLSLDIYRPIQDTRRACLPTVLIVPSGPLKQFERHPPKEWENVTSWARLFAASGLGSVTINHRFFNVRHLPLACRDVRDAAYYVHTHGPEFFLDPNRLCLLAFWGGGLLINFALREQPEFLRCLVLYSPLLDIRGMKRYQKALPEEVMESCSPVKGVSDLSQPTFPVFLARAKLDSKPLTASINAFLANAARGGVPLKVECHESGRHAFEIRDDNARTHAIIERTVAFVKELI
jgi:acetyl esterase/lipase